jgi:hypothetical protein
LCAPHNFVLWQLGSGKDSSKRTPISNNINEKLREPCNHRNAAAQQYHFPRNLLNIMYATSRAGGIHPLLSKG